MVKTASACPRCKREVSPEWAYCAYCAIALEERGDAQATLSNRIRYVRRESKQRSRRAVVYRFLATGATAAAVLLVVGGGVLLFHPAMVPSLFKPLDNIPFDEPLPKPSVRLDTAPEDEQPMLDFEWVRIPAGEFLRGKHGESYTWDLPAYDILKYEVTNNQWYRFLTEEYERLVDEKKLASYVPANWNWEPGKVPIPPEEIWSHPVVYITWTQAQEFCTRWLKNKEGFEGARLPARTEWEKAARGALDDRPWPWGDQFYLDLSDGLRQPRANTKESGIMTTLSVTQFADRDQDVSPFGVVGMAGNVAEFVGWKDGRYEAGFEGGAYLTDRFGARIGEYTETPNLDLHWSYVGFRVARQVEEPNEDQEN